jgi:ABC-type dipeptide/oligopeptide/nickel transport system permease subunit
MSDATRKALKEVRSPITFAGAGIVAALVIVAVLAPLLAPYDPRALVGDYVERPSAEHLLGTNEIGQDIFSQVVWGARTSLIVTVAGGALAILVGVLVGVGSALAGGVIDTATTRAVDVFLAIPVLPLLLVVATLAGPTLTTVILVLGLLGWPGVSRLVHSQTLTLRQRGFVQSARRFGGGSLYLIRRHLFPAIAPVVVASFIDFATVAIVLEAGLAFLGLSDPTTVSWGTVLNQALDHPGLYFSPVWTWWILPAGLAITVTVLGFTFVGIGLEPAFNPRWRRAR